MTLTRHECPSCGAPVRLQGVSSIVCDSCGSQLSRPRKARVIVDWNMQPGVSDGKHRELGDLLAYFSDEDHIPDSLEDYERASRLVELAPSHWCGYYHRAHACFWVSITSNGTFHDFFINLNKINEDIAECTRWCDDPAIPIELQGVIFSNMAEIAAHQGHRSLTGTRIENIMKMLLVCSAKLPQSTAVKQSMTTFGVALVEFSLSELKRAERQAGDGFRPPRVHLEYLFYAWKYLHVKDGLNAYEAYADRFKKNSNDSAYKAVLQANIQELVVTGLLEPRRRTSLFSMKKKSWFS